MSIFNWFSSKRPAPPATRERSGQAREEAAGMPKSSEPAPQKTERLERRELVYGVVRDSMIRAGVLAASYKFKVLSLDPRGLQYIVMMDLTRRVTGDTGQLAEIEALIVQAAKVRHGIQVTAVYWRMSEPVTAVAAHGPSGPQSAKALSPSVMKSATGAVPPGKNPPTYEPLHADEVAAFKRALSSAVPDQPLVPGQTVTTGRRNPKPPVEFEDTQLAPSDERHSPLSGTQFGEFN